MSDLFSLSGRTALVTGASRGLGRAIALGMARAGAQLILTARDEAKLREVAQDIEAAGGRAETLSFDLADLAAVEASIKSLTAKTRIDILVNNGAIADWRPLAKSTLPEWQRMLDTNVSSMYVLCRESSRGMVANGWGRLINLSSYVAQTGRPNFSAYSASKAAVLGLTRSIAAELAPSGVTCNAIVPGLFDTDMAAPTAGHPQRSKIFRDAIAMGRFGAPEDIVGPAVFLASEASAYVTGHALDVGGGLGTLLSLPVVVET